ncbi:MAG: hypothetical protein P4L79_10720 [Legionella sp.]|uniref:hypothetical protein n=1 Tax=Legionella sp. TaxID=459 RepID=UPI0028492EBA|nr:hypothetical protein [Legionella sp.]
MTHIVYDLDDVEPVFVDLHNLYGWRQYIVDSFLPNKSILLEILNRCIDESVEKIKTFGVEIEND